MAKYFSVNLSRNWHYRQHIAHVARRATGVWRHVTGRLAWRFCKSKCANHGYNWHDWRAGLGGRFFASIVTAKKVGVSKYALWGAGIGAILGIAGGIVGLIIGPAIGAVIGELYAHKNLNKDATSKATTVGIAAGLGFVLALGVKIVLVLVILAVFANAYYGWL